MAPNISANLSNTKFALYGEDWCSHLVDIVRDHVGKNKFSINLFKIRIKTDYGRIT